MASFTVEFTYRAEEHFRGHIGYIVTVLRNPDAAWDLREALDRAIDELSVHPETAPLFADPALRAFGYRRKLILGTRYLCVCRIEGSTVWIEGIYHELQDYERLLETGR